MRKQLANYFDIILLTDVESVDSESITPKAGKSTDRIRTKSNVAVLNKLQSRSGNEYFEQSANPVCFNLEDGLQNKYRNQIPVIVQLYYTDQTPLIWGTLLNPVRVSISPQVDHWEVKMQRNSVTSLF